jgi:hypothetical protein
MFFKMMMKESEAANQIGCFYQTKVLSPRRRRTP